jgi:hypothetical protein
MKKIKIVFGILGLLLLATACKRTLPSNGQTPLVKMSNGWWVSLEDTQGGQTYSYYFLSTYNDAAGDSLWVDDNGGNLTGVKVKTAVNYTQLTFSVNNGDNVSYDLGKSSDPTLSIFDGHIYPKAGHSTSGVVTDSINFKYISPSDFGPTDTLIVAGTARTGLIQDDH